MQTGGGITRKRRRMQRLLYWVMALLGAYILGKGGDLFLDGPPCRRRWQGRRQSAGWRIW
ncbi:MAG: hypothetical protein ACLTSZ_09635 [Lachnospiraceae bacterium]